MPQGATIYMYMHGIMCGTCIHVHMYKKDHGTDCTVLFWFVIVFALICYYLLLFVFHNLLFLLYFEC